MSHLLFITHLLWHQVCSERGDVVYLIVVMVEASGPSPSGYGAAQLCVHSTCSTSGNIVIVCPHIHCFSVALTSTQWISLRLGMCTLVRPSSLVEVLTSTDPVAFAGQAKVLHFSQLKPSPVLMTL